MSPSVAFIVFLVGAALLAVVAGLLAAMLQAPPLGIVACASGTFVTVLGLAMTSYLFIMPT